MIAISVFLNAEKLLPGNSGKEKFEWAKNEFLRIVPDRFDGIVDNVLQSFYEEVKSNFKALSLME